MKKFIAILLLCFCSIVKAEPWNVVYYQGGEYGDYKQSLIKIIIALHNKQAISLDEKPEFIELNKLETSKDVWLYLIKNYHSETFLFKPEGFFSSEWNENKKQLVADEAIKYAQTRPSIILGFGTWAGQMLTRTDHGVLTSIITMSDPIGAGVLKSYSEHINGYTHVSIDPNQYSEQILMFYSVIHFKHLGIMYDNRTLATRSYAGLNDIIPISKRLGFTVTECITIDEVPDVNISIESVLKCTDELIKKKVDAVLVVHQNGITSESAKIVSNKFTNANIASMSQGGWTSVKDGEFLLGVVSNELDVTGSYEANVILRLINGERFIDQRISYSKKIAINKKVALKLKISKLNSFINRNLYDIY